MSFFKDISNDWQKPIDAKKVRELGWAIFFISILIFFVYARGPIFNEGEPIIFHNVTANSIKAPTNTTAELSFGSYASGQDGDLFYNPKSLIDRFIFYSIGPLSLPDFLFFLYVGMTLFFLFRNIKEEHSFKKIFSSAYKKIAMGCFFMFIIKMLYDGIFIGEFFEYRTENQFYLQESQSASQFLYAFFGAVILPFVYFMNKGVELQQEKDLTI